MEKGTWSISESEAVPMEEHLLKECSDIKCKQNW